MGNLSSLAGINFLEKILKDNIRQTVRTPLPYMGPRSQTEDT